MSETNLRHESRLVRPPSARRSLKSSGATHTLPVYHQLSSILRQQIKDGVFPTDRPMPSEMQLASDYDVSRVTVRRALETLEVEGRIVRRHGVGTFVAPPDKNERSTCARVSGIVENLIAMGMDTECRLLEHVPHHTPPSNVLHALGLSEGDTVTKLVRLRTHQGKTLGVSTVYVPLSVSHLVQEHLLDHRPVVRILEDAGVRPYRAEQTLTAVPADDAVAKSLGIGIAMPVIRLRRTVFGDIGQALLHTVGLFNPDNYEYHTMLTRDNSTDRAQWRHIG
ncbi:MAG: GntR family transcriptional regulator [Janthinobacterium lividum]